MWLRHFSITSGRTPNMPVSVVPVRRKSRGVLLYSGPLRRWRSADGHSTVASLVQARRKAFRSWRSAQPQEEIKPLARSVKSLRPRLSARPALSGQPDARCRWLLQVKRCGTASSKHTDRVQLISDLVVAQMAVIRLDHLHTRARDLGDHEGIHAAHDHFGYGRVT